MTMSEQPATPKKPRNILIVDDDDDALLVVRTLLAGEGYAVQTACNGEEALKLIAKQLPELVIIAGRLHELSYN